MWVGGATDSPDLPTTSDAAKKRRGGGGSDGFLGNIGPGGHLHYMSYVSGEVRALPWPPMQRMQFALDSS